MPVADTTPYPARANGTLAGAGCTGTFVGPRTIVLAAHCFYDPPSAHWISYGTFAPARNGSTTPWGQWAVASFYVPTAWLGPGAGIPWVYNWDYDFAVADLNIAPGYTGSPGWYGYSSSNVGVMNMRGYPADKPTNTMWLKFGLIIGDYSTKVYKHELDITTGDSGACMASGSTQCTGIQSFQTSSYNGARKWDTTVYNFVRDYSSAW